MASLCGFVVCYVSVHFVSVNVYSNCFLFCVASGIGEWYLVYTHTHTRTNCTLETDTHTHAYTCCNSVFTSGLVLSGQVTDELGAQNMAQMIGGINIFLCGKFFIQTAS